jgi:copper chaperone
VGTPEDQSTAPTRVPMTVRITGMHCDGCVRRVERGLGKLPGVHVEHVSVGVARVQAVDAQAVVAAVQALGFAVERVEAEAPGA